MLLQLAKRGSVPVRASYTPLTRLLHASYTPLARLSSVLAHAPPASEAWQCASSRSVGTASVFVLLYSIYLALLPRAGAEWLCASSRVFVLFSICTFVLNLLALLPLAGAEWLCASSRPTDTCRLLSAELRNSSTAPGV
jgi:hypothetical protein